MMGDLMAQIIMTKDEETAWNLFMSRHNLKGARKIWLEYSIGSGIGAKITACAKYRFRTVREDITDYTMW